MSFTSLGDLAQNLLLRRQSASLQRSLSNLTSELVSGKYHDVAQSISGDFGPLATIERSLQVFEGFKAARSETDVVLTASQTTLSGLHTIVGDLGHEILAAVSLGQSNNVNAFINKASDQFENAVLLMNSRVGDRYLFSGQNATTPPIADPDAILTELRTATAAAVTSADFEQAIDDWFDLPGGGFDTLGYFGGDARNGAVRVGPSQQVRFEQTADSPAFKETLRSLGKLVLLSEGAFQSDTTSRFDVAQSAALGLIEAENHFTTQQATLGVSQGLLAAAEAQIEAERIALSEARSKLTDKDPFETASELEAVQTQIETLYTVTARNSRLNLMEYLR